MALREILTYPDSRLKLVSQPIVDLNEQVGKVLKDLEDTMYAAPGCVGVAAPQIGESIRLVMIDVSRNRKPVPNKGRMVLINPQIIKQEGALLAREGCLSLPHFTANVVRAQYIQISATNEFAELFTFESSDFEARVILHEIDHLDGLLFLDRVSSLKTDVFRRKRIDISSVEERH